MTKTPAPAAPPPASVVEGRGLIPASLLLPSAWAWLGFGIVAFVSIHVQNRIALNDYFLLRQDALGLAVAAVFLLGLRMARPLRPGDRGERRPIPRLVVPAICLGVLALGAAGWPLVFERHTLSMDEFWAAFDTAIFKRGRLAAPVAEAWRTYVPALQPLWRLETQGDTILVSTYLPLNAAARALFGRLGLEAFASPAWAALGCAALFASARKVWPDRRDAALVALVLVATSSQLLITAMTPYAMSAHFGLNMLWLLLFLQRRPWALALALGVGALACGLHQLVFHLLFAAPFVLELWIARRFRAAALYTLGYTAIALFWMSYWALLLAAAGASTKAHGGMGALFFLERVAGLLEQFKLSGAAMMAENLLRFIAWQNPLLVPLALAGGAAVWKAPEVLRPLAAGVLLTVAAAWVILPYQGHGWGYRYLHGELGSIGLVAAAGWVRVTEQADSRERGRPGLRQALVLAVATAVLVLLPLHAWQARAFAGPYAAAQRAIDRSGAEIVLVDPTGVWFGEDFVRNDPFLQSRTKVMLLSSLTPTGVRRLCATRDVAIFDRRAAGSAKVRPSDEPPRPTLAPARAVVDHDPACRNVRAL